MQPSHTFISYSRADGEFALKLGNELRAAGVDVWLDQLDIPPGARWDRAVEQALQRAGRILVVLSPASASSENVQDEIGLAFDSKKSIIPILCAPCDVPMRLRRLQHIDFTKNPAQALQTLLTVMNAPVTAAPDSAAPAAPAPAAAAPAPMAAAPARPPAAAPATPPGPSTAAAGGSRKLPIAVGIVAVVVAGGVWLSRGGDGATAAADPSAAPAANAAKSAAALAAAEANCAAAQGQRSKDQGPAATLSVNNGLDQPVTVYWIDQEGKADRRSRIAPRQSEDFSTYEGHLWMVKNAGGDCLDAATAPATLVLR